MRARTALMGAAAGAGLLVSLLTPSLAAEDAAAPKPPVARKAAHTTSLHGDTLQDDYFWMREKTNPEVRAHLEAENAYSSSVMKPTEPLQERLYQEMLGRIKETDLTVPYRDRGWFYYSRTEKGKSYPIYCRKKGSLEAAEEVMLDVNELARGEKFMSVSFRRVSDDGNLLAYGTDNTGFRDYRLHVRDLKTGKDLPDTADRVTSAAWAADNRTLFYATTDPAKRPFRLWRHALGADAKADAILYEEKDEMFRVGVYRTRNGEYLFFPSNSLTTSEVRYLKANAPASEFGVVTPRRHNVEYAVEPRAGVFYILTNDAGRNKRVVTAPAADPRPENWKELIAHRDDVMLEDIDVFQKFAVITEREDALPRLKILDFASGKAARIEFPEQIYTAGLDTNKINMAGGHGGSSGRYDRLRERAFDQAFLLTQLGVEGSSVPAAAK